MYNPDPHPRASLSDRLGVLLVLAALPVMASAVHAQTAPPVIVTDIPATHALTAIVTQGVSDPVLLLETGADPHDFALRPSQARAVSNAGLAVWMGADMTPWMGRAVTALAPTAQLELLGVEGLHLQPYRAQVLFGEAGHGDATAAAHTDDDHGHSDGGHSDEGHDDHAHGDHAHDDHAQGDHAHEDHSDHAHGDDTHDAHAHDDHGHSDHGHSDHGHGDHAHAHGDGPDPHAWLDIDNAVIWLDAIAARLSEIDPANAALYTANAASGRDSLAALDAELRAILQPVGDAGLVMHHDAYGYFATAYGLNILGSVSLGEAASPGAARLATLRDNLTDAGAVCIFPEVNHTEAYVGLLTEGASLRIGPALDPEGVSLTPGPDLYAALMRGLAQSIADCVTAG